MTFSIYKSKNINNAPSLQRKSWRDIAIDVTSMDDGLSDVSESAVGQF